MDHQEQNNIKADIFRAYDIRGIYPSDFNESTAYFIGVALGNRIQGQKKAVVAMDGRLSGPNIKTSLINGLQAAGVEVTDCGMIPTPLLYFATHSLEIPNGFMVTGSHNPKNYNGIKMIINGSPLFDKDIYALRDWIHNNPISAVDNQSPIRKYEMIVDDYIKRVKRDTNISTSKKIIVDCMNGVTGAVVDKILKSFHINADYINSKVDGNFPNCSPDPTKEVNLENLKSKVTSANADYGVAFDGDGDRTVIIRKDGSVLWPDELMILFSKSVLMQHAKAKIVYDVKCTRNLKINIINDGGIPLESRTGHSYIKQTIKKESAKLGGEMSGHIFFNDKWYGFDDGIYVFLRFLEILSQENQLLKALEDLPKTYTTPEIDIEFKGNSHFKFIEEFIKLSRFDEYNVSLIDGIKISNDESWGLIRASNTSPKITLRFESATEDGLKSIKNDIKNAILKIDNKLDLPF